MLNRTITGVLLAVFLLVLGSAAYALPPRVSWIPAELMPSSTAPGQTATYTVTLKHTGLLPIPATKQLKVVAGGDIAPFVTINQPSFPPVFKRGNQVVVSVRVSVPIGTPMVVKSGELVLQRVLPNGKVTEVWRADKLPVSLTFSSIPLPPDPGEEGKANLLGSDSDSNGVRDDMDRYIVFTYSGSMKKIEALKQEARAEQIFLRDWESKENTLGNAPNRHRAWGCTWHIFEVTDPDPPNGRRAGYRAVDSLVSQLLNTRERITAFRKADHHLGGMVTHGPEGIASECSFDPASLPN